MKEQGNIVYGYAVILNRRKIIRYNCKIAETIKTVERDEAVLAFVKKVPPRQDDCHKEKGYV